MSTFLDAHQPAANPENVFVSPCGRARFTLLTSALIRLEYQADAVFEDRASLAFINRNTPTVDATTEMIDGRFTIRTEHITLSWTPDTGPFSEDNLRVAFHIDDNTTGHWTPATPDTGNLGGTCRTLDGVSGACPLEPGLLSRQGWALVDDSDRLLFDSHPETNLPWPVPRPEGDHRDWYLFAHGRDYRRALADFTAVAGPVPTPPLYALGLWWSRYWPYSDTELKDLVAEFRANDVPLDVLVIDMDWHLDGWTGYTWNNAFFPDPQAFLKWCHDDEQLRVTLNLHPADGVGKHEHCFHEMAHHLGHDTSYVYRIPFDCTDPTFMDAYFSYLHHPLEADGIDFWWMDWQQGADTNIPGLDPLFWLNHLHWVDMEHNSDRGNQRPLVFSRWGGLGNHRYQIGFSGDTYNNWESLAFQPYFTANAANVGYTWWSHDIGGHQPGPVDDELYVRWIQYGAFSPILRTHCGRHPEAERRIWAFPAPFADAMKGAIHLRYELTPHIYSHVRAEGARGVPLCAPMYHAHPDLEDAYDCPDQYLFTHNLLVAPVIQAADATSDMAPVRTWLPPGTWVNWYTGETVDGPRTIHRLTPLDEIPLWVLANDGPVHTAPGLRRAADAFDGDIELRITHRPDEQEHTSTTYLTEDDGVAVLDDAHVARTPVTVLHAPHAVGIDIQPTQGDMAHATRTYQVRIPDTYPPAAVAAETNAGPVDADWTWDADTFTTRVTLTDVDTTQGARLTVRFHPAQNHQPLRAGIRGRLTQLRRLHDMLADAPVPALTEMRDIVASLSQLPHDKVEAEAVTLHETWPRLIPEIAESDIEPDLRQRAIAQLLHLCCEIKVDAVADDRIGAHAAVHFNAHGAEVDARVALHADAGAEHHADAEAHARTSDGLDTELDIDLPEYPDRVEVNADVRLRFGAVDATVTYQRDALRSINAWRILGPFPEERGRMHEVVFAPERDAGQMNPERSYTTPDGELREWITTRRRIARGDELANDFLVDFIDVFGQQHDDATAYALAFIDAPADMAAVMAVGSDDGNVVWVNGEEVHRRKVERAYSAGQDKFPIHLKRGRNEILLRIGQVAGGWCFSARIQDEHGRPLPLRTSLSGSGVTDSVHS